MQGLMEGDSDQFYNSTAVERGKIWKFRALDIYLLFSEYNVKKKNNKWVITFIFRVMEYTLKAQ